MIQKFAFTTAAMAAALEDTPVSYEDLADIEKEFELVETEIVRKQVELTQPLYEQREKTVSKIPNFWPLVLEQAPPDIDQYIQPSDSALLLSSLSSLSVSHFELPKGDPRSFAIKFTFAENDYFTDSSLEKKFWYRKASDGWSGLVSEPVAINWKKGKDLTGGLLDLVVAANNSIPSEARTEDGEREMNDEQKALLKKIENTGMGGLSFFAWFGFIGRRVSAEESEQAYVKEREYRAKRKAGEKVSVPEEVRDEDLDFGMELEIFPDGDDLAIAFTEDLWPGAVKYFTQAQEQDALSDADFESDDEEAADLNELLAQARGDGLDDSSDDEERPAKKRSRV